MANKNWTKIIIHNDRLLNFVYCEDEADLRIISRGNTLRVSDQLDEMPLMKKKIKSITLCEIEKRH